MLKFLRRYSKYILAVFGSLLLVVFLAPTVVEDFAQQQAQGSAIWATLEDGDDLGLEVRDAAGYELERLQPFIDSLPPLAMLEIDSPEHWYLLTREAEEAGLVAPLGSIGLDPTFTAQFFLRLGAGRTSETMLAKLQGVVRLIDRWTAGMPVSDTRLRAQSRKFFHGVTARIVPIEATAEGMPEPAESAIAAHYDAYRDIEPGQGEGPGAFGYRLPNRFTIEMLHVPAASITAAVESSGDLGEAKLQQHWIEHLDDTVRNFPEFVRGQRAPQAVRDDLRAELTDAKRDAISKWIVGRQLETSRGLTEDDFGFLVLPEDWSSTRVDLAAMVDGIPEAFAGIDGLVYTREDQDMLTLADLADERFFPAATTDRFGEPRPLAALIAASREFGGDGRYPIQAGLLGPMLQTADGDLVAFRLLRADGARAPESVDEVREDVVRDLKRLAAWDALKADRPALESIARNQGLLELALERGSSVSNVSSVGRGNPLFFEITQGDPRQMFTTPLPVVGADTDVIDAIVAHALEQPTTAAATSLPVEDRIRGFESERALTMLVVELTDQAPLDEGQFGRISTIGTLSAVVATEDLEIDDLSPRLTFSYEQLASRHGFELRRSRDAESPSATDDADVEAAAETETETE